MKPSLREQLVKQSLNTATWSRYIACEAGDGCSLLVSHHHAFDSDELTTDCFDLNLSLLKALRAALHEVVPFVFGDFFGFEEDVPRKVHQRTKLYSTLKNADDTQLASICPLFGGCLFQPRHQDRLIQSWEHPVSPNEGVASQTPFHNFLMIYWLSAWQHAGKYPRLTPFLFGLEPELVRMLRFMTSQQLIGFLPTAMNTRFIFKMNEALVYAATHSPRHPTVRLFQVANLVQHRTETQWWGFKEK